MQGVLPTMVHPSLSFLPSIAALTPKLQIILAAYYTIADIVLLFQCLYYRHRNSNPSASHLSPATPLLDPSKDEPPVPPTSAWKAALFNFVVICTVCLAGVVGWYLSPPTPPNADDDIVFNPLGQLFGYLCAVLYLASRVPQILLNYKRRSCEGVSILFFLFAGIGNATYVLSILAVGEDWSKERYWRYVGVNASWLAGSLGTMVLDLAIFGQFFLYQNDEEKEEECEAERERLLNQ